MAPFRQLRRAACAIAIALLPPTALAQLHAARGASLSGCWPVAVLDRGCVLIGTEPRAPVDVLLLPYRSPWNVPQLPSPDGGPRRASYPIDTGWVRVVPTVVYVPEPSATVPGVVSVGLERAAPGDPLRAKAELGWSGRPGGSLELDYRIAGRQASFKAQDRPAGAAVLPNGRAPGSTWDGTWTERLGPTTAASLSISGDRLDLDGREPEARSAQVSVRHRAADGWKLFGSMTGASYAESTGSELRRGVAALGTEISAGPLALEAVYRDQSSSSSSGPGHGGRVTLRTKQGGWQASLYADAQQQAATLQLDALGQLEPMYSLAELGLVGGSPEHVVRVLRDRGQLVAQHAIELGALRLDPLRVQGGFDVKWRDAGLQGAEVGLRLAMDDLQGTDAPRRALLGQVQMSWRVFRETDFTASYASWTLQGEPSYDDNHTIFRLLVRSRL